MTKNIIIKDFLPPPKMKKKTKSKLLSKQRNIKNLSYPKQLRIKKINLIGSSSPTHKKLTRIRTKFTIEDNSPPKQPSTPKQPTLPKQRKQFLIIDKTPSPPKQQNVLPPTHVSALEPASNQCCSCFNSKKNNIKDTYCVWCELHNHLEKCFSQIGNKKNKRK